MSNANGTNGSERRRARSDLKELVKLAAEMREPVRPPVASSARITIPPVTMPAPPIAARVSITVTQEREGSGRRGPWRSVVVGGCVGISLSALGLGALVVRRDAMRASSGHAETSAMAASVTAVASRAATLGRAIDVPAPPVAAPDALPLAAPTKPETAATTLSRGSMAKPIAKPNAAKVAAPAAAAPPAPAPAKSDLVDLMRASVAGKPKPAP